MSFFPDIGSGGGGTPAGANKSIQYNNSGTFGGIAIGTANQVFGVNAAGNGYEFKTITAGTAITVTHGVGTITIANNGVTALTGTANQVSVSGATGSVTLSLPQNIHTAATPTFAGQTLSGHLIFSAGAAVTAANYEIGRDNAGTNALYFNVPTGASMSWNINNTAKLTLDEANGLFYTRSSGAQVRFIESVGTPGSGTANIYVAHNNATTGSFLFGGSSSGGVGSYSATHSFGIYSANTIRLSFDTNGHAAFTQTSATSSGTTQGIFVSFTPANNTGMTAATEQSTYKFFAATQTWNTGGITNQREIFIDQPTYAFAGGSTITNAANLYIKGAPIAGTNATLTNRYSLWIDDDAARFDGRVLQAKGANVASANDLTLGTDGNVFSITGNTQINAITIDQWTAGSEIVLIFAGAPTVKHNTAGGAGTAVIFLSGSADLVAAVNTVLTLVYDGTRWQERSRKVA